MVRRMILQVLTLASILAAMNAGATGPDDCRKSLAMLDAAMQLEDVQLASADQLDAVVAECAATWPRYRGYISCAKQAKGHDDLIACVDLWQRRLRRQRGQVVAAQAGAGPQVEGDGGGARRLLEPGSRLQLSLNVTPDGVCWYDNRLFSAGAVLQMPGDNRAYRCVRRDDGQVMAWIPGAKP